MKQKYSFTQVKNLLWFINIIIITSLLGCSVSKPSTFPKSISVYLEDSPSSVPESDSNTLKHFDQTSQNIIKAFIINGFEFHYIAKHVNNFLQVNGYISIDEFYVYIKDELIKEHLAPWVIEQKKDSIYLSYKLLETTEEI